MAKRRKSSSRHKKARADLRERAKVDKLLRQSIELGDTEYMAALPLEGNFIAQLGLEDIQRRADKKGPLGLSEYIRHIMKTDDDEIANKHPSRNMYNTLTRGTYAKLKQPPRVPPSQRELAGSMFINTTDAIDEFGPPEGEHAKDQALLERRRSGNPVVMHELGHAGLDVLRQTDTGMPTAPRMIWPVSDHDIIYPLDAATYHKDFPKRLLSEDEQRRVNRFGSIDRSINPANIRMGKALAYGPSKSVDSNSQGIWEALTSFLKSALWKTKRGEKLSSREQATVDYIKRLQKTARATQVRKRAK